MPRTPADAQAWISEHDPLSIVPLEDPLVESLGCEPRSVYAETYWLPVLGPSALWALRRLAAWTALTPDGATVALSDLAHELGLGGGTGRNAPLVRTLARIVVFEMARIDESRQALAVRRVLPPLALRHVRRLPAHLAERHQTDLLTRKSPSNIGAEQPLNVMALHR